MSFIWSGWTEDGLSHFSIQGWNDLAEDIKLEILEYVKAMCHNVKGISLKVEVWKTDSRDEILDMMENDVKATRI